MACNLPKEIKCPDIIDCTGCPNNGRGVGKTDAKAPKTTRQLVSTGAPCCLAKLGLTEKESAEWEDFLKMHIAEVTQEDWQRFHELNDKYLSALVEECKRIEAR